MIVKVSRRGMRVVGNADVGSRSDTSSDTSLYGLVKLIDTNVDTALVNQDTMLDHIHSAQMCYPTLDDAVTVTASASAWTYGDYVQIIPASTITSIFDIHFINIETASGNDVYQMELSYGDSDTVACTFRFVKSVAIDPSRAIPVVCVQIPANSRVRARLATAAGSSTADITVCYHTY